MDLAKSLKNVIALANHGIRTMPGLSEEVMAELALDVVAVKRHAAEVAAPVSSPEKA